MAQGGAFVDGLIGARVAFKLGCAFSCGCGEVGPSRSHKGTAHYCPVNLGLSTSYQAGNFVAYRDRAMSFKHLFKRTENQENVAVMPDGGSKTNRALGLRKCVEPRDASRAIDIVFVHGLTGNRERTWTHPSTSCFWPSELLPSDLPDARIFTYGYDADVAHFFSAASQSRIGDHAQTLLSSLGHVRERTETGTRPLFFVAHSLGGLVVEDTLLYSKNSAEIHLQQVLESTEGICFMGTPHCGSQLADWAKVFTSVAKLVKRLNESIITILKPESEVLARIQQEFQTMIRARNDAGKPRLRITCFFEDLDTPGIGAVVPKHSAILAAYSSISIAGDHSGMTKFLDAEDPGFQRVSGELWIWARDLNKRREKARQETGSASSSLPSKQPQTLLESGIAGKTTGNTYFQGSMHNVGQVFQGGNITLSQFDAGLGKSVIFGRGSNSPNYRST